ncbi:MAG: SpoIIIAH-like family protein [Ruminococcaceae bacterium]|nr:SpoIIIAH-like family protein [Oscillospiraceae bacterium]
MKKMFKKLKMRDFKMHIYNKKLIVALSLVVIVGVAGYLNFMYDASEQTTLKDYIETVQNIENDEENAGEIEMVDAPKTSAENYFVTARLNRETARSEGIELLKNTINNENVSDEAKIEAENKIFKISDNIENEVNIENIIKSKGFSNVLVSITDSGVNVSIQAKNLTAPETAQIYDAVNQFVNTNNVKIVEVQ